MYVIPICYRVKADHLLVLFTDPNSNGTKTTCTQSWTGSNVTNGAPLGNRYSQCAATNNTSEGFQWKFGSVNSLSSFQAEFTHGFNDPA